MKLTTTRQYSPDFFTFSGTLISELISDGRYGTSQSYTKAVTSLRTYLQEEALQHPDAAQSPTVAATVQLPLCNIDGAFIYRYNLHLTRRGVIRNSISFYNRTLRAIYNQAVRRFRLQDRRPFDEVYTGVDRTRNRAVGESIIAALITLDLSRDKSLEQARDLFVFSYYMRGIPFVDMAYLRRENIRGGYIIYTRKKTGARIEVRIEPQIRAILQKYSRKESDYLLPILQDAGKKSDEGFLYRRYQVRLSIYNRRLKELSCLLGGSVTLTSYVSRHSWATAARNSDISLSVISESLGHSSEHMTRIYLGSFNGKLIDSANHKLMGRIKKRVSLRDTNNGLQKRWNSDSLHPLGDKG